MNRFLKRILLVVALMAFVGTVTVVDVSCSKPTDSTEKKDDPNDNN